MLPVLLLRYQRPEPAPSSIPNTMIPRFADPVHTEPPAWNATLRQWPSIVGLVAAGPTPPETRYVRWLRRSRTKMSDVEFESPGARFDAVDWNATQCGTDVIEPSSAG